MRTEFVVEKEAELHEIAAAILSALGSPGPVALYGEMGAGKTTLISALCKQLGSNDRVSSPTFSLHNVYLDAGGREIYHMDLYRLESENELLQAGIAESLEHDFWVFIEWPQLAEGFLEPDFKTLQIEVLPDDSRKISIL